ncbi:MAG: class II fumarate hydratase [Ilumatobacter sp.]|nr:MAG: class II fumarate hydratase [Ilumatobacter sp.]
MDDTARLWGPETAKAIDNFPVSGEPIPVGVVRWLARIKAEAARVNAELGLLDPVVGAAIGAAADAVVAGDHDHQFPVDVFQTGSGTSSNMNANEVIAALAGSVADLDDRVNPNDHVNMGQSSNDVFPTAVHLAALESITGGLLPALDGLARSLSARADEFSDVVKAGRTHLMDAVPVMLGQEFAGYAAQVRLGADRVADTLPRLARVPLGGTATGTGLNTHPEFAERVRARLHAATGLPVEPPADPFEAQGARDALVEVSGALKVVAVSLTKIVNDLRWMASGPRTGLAEIHLPELQKGSSIMPGKVNPVIPEVVAQVAAQVIGNDTAITVGGMQGNLELNVMIPMMARNLLGSIDLLASACRLLDERCVAGIRADRDACERHAEHTLATATALNPHIGYDRATEIVREAAATGRPLRDVAREHGVAESALDEALDLHRIARGSAPPTQL